MLKAQPVLVGTVSIETNELLSAYLRREGVAHEILNAKNHEARRREIVAGAGAKGRVTVATNMGGPRAWTSSSAAAKKWQQKEQHDEVVATRRPLCAWHRAPRGRAASTISSADARAARATQGETQFFRLARRLAYARVLPPTI